MKDSFFPADLLLLAVPASADGLAYVETINLDGESNLKIKKALDQTQQITLDTMQDFTVTNNACSGIYALHKSCLHHYVPQAHTMQNSVTLLHFQ